MKKIFLSLLLLLASTGAIFAQSSLLATLSHEGEISVFYGPDALKDAHAAAQHGDAITLSSGSFNAVDITKAITLRGAGIVVDVVKNIYPTIISGDFRIAIENSVEHNLTIEGIFNNFRIEINKDLNNVTFIKNRFKEIIYQGSSLSYKNNRFIHCKISQRLSAISNSGSNSLSFTNCYIASLENHDCPTMLQNSIIGSVGGSLIVSYKYCTFYNCIIIGGNPPYVSYNVFDASNTIYNSITTLITQDNLIGHMDYTYKNVINYNNYIIQNIDNVFKTFKANNYSEEETFELIDDVKNNYFGTDGTQVGIYGGALPYSPVTTNPQITKCNVASRSTADGKLSVDIEVKAGE